MGVNRHHRNRGAAALAQGAAAISDRPDLELSEDDIVGSPFSHAELEAIRKVNSAIHDMTLHGVGVIRYKKSPPEVA